MIAPHSMLTRKLFRDLWRLRAQSFAIALVIAAGVGMAVMSFGMIRSLEATREAYYDRYRFADIFAPLKRAPESVMAEVRAIDGISVAESRVSAGAILDIPGIVEPVAARVLALPPEGQPSLNRLVLRSGRLPEPGRPDEAVASEAFAVAARLALGDTFTTLLYGKQVELRLVGTVLSPEYVYAVPPGQLFPDNRRFGILWMNREPLAAMLDLTDAFDEAMVRLEPGTSEAEVIRRLDLLLEPYGGGGAYGRDEQISNRFVTNEISQLRTTVEILPPIFLGVAAFLLNIVLARLVDTEREVIGLMKAFGYRRRDVMRHYAGLALLLSTGGMVLGAVLGTWLGRELSTLYQRFFTFPFLEFRAGVDVYLVSAGVTLAAVLAGSALAVRRAARLAPAEAMRPPLPPDFSGRLVAVASRLGPDEPTRMILRGLLRRPLRSCLTVAGLALALGLYIASASATDNVERMIDLIFGKSQRADIIVSFAEARDEGALYSLSRLPGVIRVEPFRATAARLIAAQHEEREGLSSADAGANLRRLIDINGALVEPPPAGAILSRRLAEQLEVGPGDIVRAEVTEGDRPVLDIPVMGVIESPIGSSATIDRAVLNRLLIEGRSISGAYLLVDDNQLPALYAALKGTPFVANVTSFAATVQSLRDTIAQNMGIVTMFNTGFACLIVVGVVYNSARISLAERARDLASLRVLGFRRAETAFVLLGELAILVLASLPLGILFGIGLSRYITQRYSTAGDGHADLYTIPFGMNASTMADGVLIVGAAAAITALVIRTRVDRLDLIRALKTRE
ncbi:ABC transporter permease [Allosphingosinicella vermicomposti]|uniref:ABC transporter permease n=1 Tax=Allosphingosinicella vermicomposti TaxID=614671 RepID=UPI00131A5B2B|nr:ABC transporter permease [Allosphingosinicella vermicomposti]